MYDMQDQFKFDLNKSVANSKCIFKGTKYRITVLTERLVRLEYSDTGNFLDYPTEVVWYRNFIKPEFTVEESGKLLKITTKYFELNYKKEKKFSSNSLLQNNNLTIRLLNTNKVWYYNNPEVRNYDAPLYKLNNKTIMGKSLYSLDGFVSIDDSNSSILLQNGTFKKRDNNEIDIYVFLYNNDFYSCLNDYYMLTGYPPLISRTALGNWWCKDDIYNEFEVNKFVKKLEEKNIPISYFLLDNWQTDNDFEFSNIYKNKNEIPNFLHNKNIKFGLTLKDIEKIEHNNNSYSKLISYFIPDKNSCIPINVYDPKTMDLYLKLLIEPLNNLNVDFYSIESFNKNKIDRLTILKHYLFYNDYKYGNKRPIISAYNTSVATHRYPVTYIGTSKVDWNSLKCIPHINMSATNIGVSFISHDFGGTFDGVEEAELYTRFIQLGCFSPILRIGSTGGKYYKREPWKWDLKTSIITSEYLRLRYKLIPYIYTECYKYFKYGKPLIEPLYYRYKDLYDDTLYNNEYFFGSTFLISPIISKKDNIMNRVIQKIYMPNGIWYDFKSGKRYNGNKKYVSFYKDEEYPVFVKAGAIIPLAINNYNDTSAPKNMEIVVFPGDSNTYSIYEDDGETNKYLNGEYLITNIEFIYSENNYKLTILPVSGKNGVIYEKRNYKFRFKNTKPNNKVLTYMGNNVVNNKSYKDGNDLIVEVYDILTSSQFTCLINGKDMQVDAIVLINDDITSIISDLPIKTVVKQKVDQIIFSNQYTIKKKRIEIRKLANGNNYIERKYVNLFLKLLEYVEEV